MFWTNTSDALWVKFTGAFRVKMARLHEWDASDDVCLLGWTGLIFKKAPRRKDFLAAGEVITKIIGDIEALGIDS